MNKYLTTLGKVKDKNKLQINAELMLEMSLLQYYTNTTYNMQSDSEAILQYIIGLSKCCW